MSNNPKCKHGRVLCSTCVVVSDAARRMSNTINERITFYNDWALRNCWMAFRLSDGTSDGVVYESRQAAIDHQVHETLCAYFCFRNAMSGTKPFDCQIFLNLNRYAYDNGLRLSEPQAPAMILPTVNYDRLTGRVR